jgi:hypothetical protein
MALYDSHDEEEASWTEIETRLMHGKALHDAAERSSSYMSGQKSDLRYRGTRE